MLRIVGAYIGAVLILGYCIALLIILFITVVYSVGYLYDSIFGDSLYKLGIYIAKKIPKIKKFKFLLHIKRLLEPREHFVRYETPLCTYCFSYIALAIISMLLINVGVKHGWIVAFFIYIIIYFVGMYRKYKQSGCYNLVLENNLEFLKLSFVPLAFLITLIGFIFTVCGLNLQEINFVHLSTIITSVQEQGLLPGLANEIWLVVESSIAILLLLYIASIPMQLVSYYIILTIKYFQKYGYAYKKIFSFFWRIWKNIGL